ncbi:MAG: hypothetical protein GC204_07690 [Chloroflexi bacterium]|nr:hypothetical protein [Chloroflexota bacterium]
MINWDVNSLSLMQEENIKKAEKEHLAQEIIDETRKVNPNYNPTLAWFGRRVAEVGIRLVHISGSDEDKRILHDAEIHLN